MKPGRISSQVLKEAFNFSDGEEKFIVNAKIGQGVLVTQEGRIPFYNLLSDEERRLFTTKPKDITVVEIYRIVCPLLVGYSLGGRNKGNAKDTSDILVDRTETMVSKSTSAIR